MASRERHFARLSADESVDFAADTRHAGDGSASSGPALRILIDNAVGHGSDAEVGIVGHERDGGRTLLRYGKAVNQGGENARLANREEAFV